MNKPVRITGINIKITDQHVMSLAKIDELIASMTFLAASIESGELAATSAEIAAQHITNLGLRARQDIDHLAGQMTYEVPVTKRA